MGGELGLLSDGVHNIAKGIADLNGASVMRAPNSVLSNIRISEVGEMLLEVSASLRHDQVENHDPDTQAYA